MAGSRWRAVTGWLGRRPAALPLLILTGGLVALTAGPAPAEGSWTGVPDADLIQNALVVLILIGAIFGLVLLVMARGERQEAPPQKRSWLPSLAALLIIFLFSLTDFEGELLPEEEAEEQPAPVTGAEPIEVAPGEGFEPSDGLALALVVVAAAALLLWSRQGLAAFDEIEEGEDVDAEALRAAVARAHEHLLDRGEPRAAVLLAYRDLERALESLDLARRESETPTEHLTRALRTLSIDDPAQARPLVDLADLYARARFSDHAITAADRDRAAEALGRARERLVGHD